MDSFTKRYPLPHELDAIPNRRNMPSSTHKVNNNFCRKPKNRRRRLGSCSLLTGPLAWGR